MIWRVNLSYLILLTFLSSLQVLGSKEATRDARIKLSLTEKFEQIKGYEFKNPYRLSHFPIVPGSEIVKIDDVTKVRGSDYTINYALGEIVINTAIDERSIISISYEIIPISIQRVYQRELFKDERVERAKPAQTEVEQAQEEPPNLTLSGTKTFALSLGNIKGVSLEQPTRVNVSGNVSEDIKVTAMLSDENLPLQPEGTTEELEDLDKILIRIEGKNLSATLGDYEAGFGETEFVLLNKPLEGAQASGEFDIAGFNVIGAVSKGKSSSITIRGIEGQNEYRVTVDGKYIIMIAGSETVWLNGQKMRRERDYIIRDYGDPIIEFTNKHLITSNDVISVDFEYIEEDQAYKRNLYGIRGKINKIGDRSRISIPSSKMFTIGMSYATETDDKDNPLFILTEEDLKRLRSNLLDIREEDKPLIAPTSHSVMGIDAQINPTKDTSINGEIAFSKLDTNTFSTVDDPQQGVAWKISGLANFKRTTVSLDIRNLDANFLPIGATFLNRNRSVYQRNFDNLDFGTPAIRNEAGAQTLYNFDISTIPVKFLHITGTAGMRHVRGLEFDDRSSYWNGGIKLLIPNLPKLSGKYQEVSTNSGKKLRRLLEAEHMFFKGFSIRFKDEDIESFLPKGDDKRSFRSLHLQTPDSQRIGASCEYSYDVQYYADKLDRDRWLRSSTARTAMINIFARPKSWFNLSSYFAQRRFNSELEGSTQPNVSTNVGELKLQMKDLRVNYQVDRKLSSEGEEQYVNYIVTIVDGKEEKRYLKPGEGMYVKIDEYTYRQDIEKGEYIRILKTVRDRPVMAVSLNAVYNYRGGFPRTYLSRPEQKLKKGIGGLFPTIELGIRLNAEKEESSKELYLLRGIENDDVIYSLKKYWFRIQTRPIRRLIISSDWDVSKTRNNRIHNRSKEINSGLADLKVEGLFSDTLSIGTEIERGFSLEKTAGIQSFGTQYEMLSDISERRFYRSVFLKYSPSKALSRLDLTAEHEREWNTDVLSSNKPVLTRTISLGSEALFSFSYNGSITVGYKVSDGESSDRLPFAKYDFHEGISHKTKIELNYKLQKLTDIFIRATYRSELARDAKPDHRLEMEATANF